MTSRSAHDWIALEVPPAAFFDGLPGGVIGWNERTTDATGIGKTDVTILTEGVPVNAGRLIEISVKVEIVGDPTGVQQPAVRVFRDSALLDRHTYVGQPADFPHTAAFNVYDKGPTAGTHTYKVTVRSESDTDDVDTLQVIVNPGIECRMVVKDIGPWPL